MDCITGVGNMLTFLSFYLQFIFCSGTGCYVTIRDEAQQHAM